MDQKMIEAEIDIVRFESNVAGVTVKADTLGSLEAIIKLLEDKGIKIKRADIGDVTRKDVMELCGRESCERSVIFAFNVKVNEVAESEAEK